MKVLMWYCSRFAYLPAQKALENADVLHGKKAYFDAAVGFIHAEAQDPAEAGEVEKKLLKNLKWMAGKNNTRVIILHSFSHLSESKADPEWTRAMFNRVQERLESAGYDVIQTPFGWFLDLDMAAPGHSLARIFKAF